MLKVVKEMGEKFAEWLGVAALFRMDCLSARAGEELSREISCHQHYGPQQTGGGGGLAAWPQFHDTRPGRVG